MPRGSKPGERRGGRQRGTPNKRTALKNAVLCAAAPNGSPLDFMLGLMRDPKVPLDLRIDMAHTAAPFVHTKPRRPVRMRTDPMDSAPLKGAPDSSAARMEEALSPDGQGRGHSAAHQAGLDALQGGGNDGRQAPSFDGGQVPSLDGGQVPSLDGGPVPSLGGEDRGTDGSALSPLRFLLSVMNDAEATSGQRIRAARIAARYVHAPTVPEKMAPVDEYGFSISRTLAKAIFDDWDRRQLLKTGIPSGLLPAAADREIAQICARQNERDDCLQCPPGYSAEKDEKRSKELQERERRPGLTGAERTEWTYVIARMTASRAHLYRGPEGRARRRLEALGDLPQMRSAGRARAVGLTDAERSEERELLNNFPALAKEFRPYKSLVEHFQECRDSMKPDDRRRRSVERMIKAMEEPSEK